MKLVDLSLPALMLELPHPLLADGVDLHRSLGRPRLLEEDQRTPGEENHANAKGNQRPGQFQRKRALNLLGARMDRLPVLDGEKKDERKNQQREKCRHSDQQEIESIDLPCQLRGTFREKWEVL